MRITTITAIFSTILYASLGCGSSPASSGGTGGTSGAMQPSGISPNAQPSNNGAATWSSQPSGTGGSASNADGQAGAPSHMGTGGDDAGGAADMHDASTGGTSGSTGTGGANPSSGAGGTTVMNGTGGTSGNSADGGIDLGGLFGDAGDPGGGSTAPGDPDPNGPCEDLNLICFDIFDMWANPECQTCNHGQGCQGCAIPFAF